MTVLMQQALPAARPGWVFDQATGAPVLDLMGRDTG